MDMRTLLSAQGFDTDSLSDDQLAVYHTLFRRRDVRREFAGEVVDRERLMPCDGAFRNSYLKGL